MSRPGSVRARSAALIAAMAAGSVVLWIGIPAFWVLAAGQLSDVGAPAMGPIVLVLTATPLSMILFAPLLTRLDRRHRELRGATDGRPIRAPWLRSMRDGGDRREHGVLEIVMIVSVVLAFAAIGGWIALFGRITMPA